MRLGYGQLAAVMGRMHAGVEQRVVDARLKYFQRRAFPSEELLVGRGWRADYGPEELLKLVLAFELLALGIAPGQAAALVGESWAGVADRIGAVWLNRSSLDYPNLLVARVDGLEAKRGGSGSITDATGVDPGKWTMAGDPADRRLLILDVVKMAKALDGALSEGLFGKTLVGARQGLDQWATTGGSEMRETGS